MLVLSRCSDESVAFYIDGKKIAEVTVTQILQNKVKLGFTADPDSAVAIVRSELSAEITSEFIQRTHVKKDAVK